MNPNPTSRQEPQDRANPETIPPDAPFIYLNPENTKKVVLVSTTNILTKVEFDRLKAWVEDQFFVVDKGGDEDSEEE